MLSGAALSPCWPLVWCELLGVLALFNFRTQYSLGFHMIISISQNCLNINGFYHFNRPESISDSCLRTLMSITTFYSKEFFPNVML